MFADRKTCQHCDTRREDAGTNQVPEHPRRLQWRLRGKLRGSRRQVSPYHPANLDWIPSASLSSLPPLPSGTFLWRWNTVNFEREQWVVALVHCYANVTQIGVLNLALTVPSCFVFPFPDTHSEMHRADVSWLCTPITHPPSQRGGPPAAATAALRATERALCKMCDLSSPQPAIQVRSFIRAQAAANCVTEWWKIQKQRRSHKDAD